MRGGWKAMAGVVVLIATLAVPAGPVAAEDYPTWDQVQAAKADVATREAEATRITAFVDELEAEAGRLGDAAVEAAAVSAAAEAARAGAEARAGTLRAASRRRGGGGRCLGCPARTGRGGPRTFGRRRRDAAAALRRRGRLRPPGRALPGGAARRHLRRGGGSREGRARRRRRAQRPGGRRGGRAHPPGRGGRRRRRGGRGGPRRGGGARRRAAGGARHPVRAAREPARPHGRARAPVPDRRTGRPGTGRTGGAPPRQRPPPRAGGGGGSAGDSGAPPPGVVVDRAAAKAYAASRLPSYGWGSDQFRCLDLLWTRESGWRADAYNGSSGAYGIPQSLPGSKMASAGADWRTNAATQINWGLGYIDARYGSPCGAWAHSEAYQLVLMATTGTDGRPGRTRGVPPPRRGGRAAARRRCCDPAAARRSRVSRTASPGTAASRSARSTACSARSTTSTPSASATTSSPPMPRCGRVNARPRARAGRRRRRSTRRTARSTPTPSAGSRRRCSPSRSTCTSVSGDRSTSPPADAIVRGYAPMGFRLQASRQGWPETRAEFDALVVGPLRRLDRGRRGEGRRPRAAVEGTPTLPLGSHGPARPGATPDRSAPAGRRPRGLRLPLDPSHRARRERLAPRHLGRLAAASARRSARPDARLAPSRATSQPLRWA